ncbi:MAG TPA: DUF2203 domain-containing protein [Planctomycetota bacterium]|nr:DUF2203 domain-containing protein [Planctomycetota bacterium]
MVRRHYSPDLANRSLPLVRRIAVDLRDNARAIQTAWLLLQKPGHGNRQVLQQRLDDLREQFQALVRELEQLGVELKDPLTGLLDFRAMRAGEEVYLCWRIGEDHVGHWHSLDGGFAARRPLSEY